MMENEEKMKEKEEMKDEIRDSSERIRSGMSKTFHVYHPEDDRQIQL